MRRSVGTALAAAALLVPACGDSDTSPNSTGETTAEQRYPDVVSVEAQQGDDGRWTFRVTMSSPYDTSERYADGWRVIDGDGTVFGVHDLAHDHANEQPFTRTQRGVAIPDAVTEVIVEGRDQRYGFGGASMTVTLAHD